MQKVKAWFDGTLGQQILQTEAALIEQLLPGFFGHHLLQLSVQAAPLYHASHIGHRFSLRPSLLSAETQPACSVSANVAQLPFENDSIDVVLVHHILDFSPDPQQLLREVTRVSRPRGHLVIIGFNPLSLWGLWKSLAGFRVKPPWHGRFILPRRLMDWLNLLNFTIDRAQYCIYGPPTAGTTRPETGSFPRGLARKSNWPFGAVYVIVARKQVGTITPIRPLWPAARAFGPPGSLTQTCNWGSDANLQSF